MEPITDEQILEMQARQTFLNQALVYLISQNNGKVILPLSTVIQNFKDSAIMLEVNVEKETMTLTTMNNEDALVMANALTDAKSSQQH